MKNRLYGFVNKLNKAVDSVTKALENSVSENNQGEHKDSIIDRLPTVESVETPKPTPIKQSVPKPAPKVTTSNRKQESSTMAENIIFSMYVCPECRKVFKVKGNDKKVKCSHCEGIYLKDMHVEEPVWKAYGKDERDKIISNMLVEEEFEEAFEETEYESLPETGKFFDENGEFIDKPLTVKEDREDKNKINNSSTFFFSEEEKPSIDSFFSGYDNFNNGGSMPPKKLKEYSKPPYIAESNKRTNSGKPVTALILLIMVGFIYFVGSSLFGKDSNNKSTANEVTTKAYSGEAATKPVENRPIKSNDSFQDNLKQDKYTNNTVTYKNEAATTKPAEKKASAGNSKKSTNNSKSIKEKAVVPEPEDAQGNLVWIPTNGGKKYHSRSSCSGMKNPEQVTVEYAKSKGFTPCKKCY